MLDSPRRPTLFFLAVLLLGTLTASAASTFFALATAPWWLLVLGLCLALPWGASTARSPRSRLAAMAALLSSALVLVGGMAATDSFLLVLAVALTLWCALALMVTPQLRGHRLVGLVLFGTPVALACGLLPLIVGSRAAEALPLVDLGAGARALASATGPILLIGGAAVLIGTVVDLAARLRTQVRAESLRSVAYIATGVTSLLVAAAGAVASGTVAGTASRIGLLGTLLVVVAALAVRRGLHGLASTREISPVSGSVGAVAMALLLLGTAAVPASSLLTGLALFVLLGLAAILGAVGGLCGAAALLRTGPEPANARLRHLVPSGLRRVDLHRVDLRIADRMRSAYKALARSRQTQS